MKSAKRWAIALLVACGTAAAHAQGYGGNTGGSALGAPINVPPPPPVAAVPAQPLTPPAAATPRVFTPSAPPPSAPPLAAPQFGPPGGAEPILGEPEAAPPGQTGPGPTPRPAAPQPSAPPPQGAPPVGAQPGQPLPPPQNTWLPRQNAVLGVLDKEDGAVSRVAVQVGNSVVQGRLRIKILACLVRPPDQAPDAAVFLSVKNIQQTQDDTSAPPQNAGDGKTLFSGWLLRAEPGASVVDDTRDTFRLIGCGAAN